MLSQIYTLIFKSRKKCLLGLFLSLWAGLLPAQFTLTGTVLDAEDGSPLPFAWVRSLSPATGSLSDLDGKFSLSLPENADSVSFSLMGFGVQTFPADQVPEKVFLGTST